MLPGLQFTDFHKFLVSVGGLSFVAGIALPLALLRSQKTLLLPEQEISRLTPAAAEAIRSQQGQLGWIMLYWPYVSGGLLALGLALVIKGAITWRNRQSELERRDAAELSKIDAEREKTYQETLALVRQHKETEIETEQKIEEKIEKELEDVPDQSSTTAPRAQDVGREEDTDRTNDLPFPLDQLEVVGSTFDAPNPRLLRTMESINLLISSEIRILRQIRRKYAGHLDVARNIRIGSSNADLVVTSRSPDLPNLVVDIQGIHKNASNALVRDRIRAAFKWMEQMNDESRKELRAAFQPVAVLVFGDSEQAVKGARLTLQKRLDGLIKALDLMHRPSGTLILLSESDLDNRSVGEWIVARESIISSTGPEEPMRLFA